MGSWKNGYLVGLLALATIVSSGIVSAEQVYASKARATVARAHMSRARTLMVEALAEFEEARKYARPDMLIDSEDWRLRVISLTEQLNRVVDPKPRVTREGAVFRTPPRFIKRQKNQLPEVADGAQARNDIGEKARLKKKQQERAQFFNNSVDPQKTNGNVAKLPPDLSLPDAPELDAPSVGNADENANQEPAPAKNLFSNELMPNVDDQKVAEEPSKIINGNKGTVTPEDAIKERGALKNNEAVDDVDYDQKIEGKDSSIEQNEEDLLDLSDNPLLPPLESGKTNSQEGELLNNNSGEKTGSERVPVIVDDEAVDEVSSADVAKQFSEDDALAKKLEESITEKLRNR